jgi:hypothetical protein
MDGHEDAAAPDPSDGNIEVALGKADSPEALMDRAVEGAVAHLEGRYGLLFLPFDGVLSMLNSLFRLVFYPFPESRHDRGIARKVLELTRVFCVPE